MTLVDILFLSFCQFVVIEILRSTAIREAALHRECEREKQLQLEVRGALLRGYDKGFMSCARCMQRIAADMIDAPEVDL